MWKRKVATQKRVTAVSGDSGGGESMPCIYPAQGIRQPIALVPPQHLLLHALRCGCEQLSLTPSLPYR